MRFCSIPTFLAIILWGTVFPVYPQSVQKGVRISEVLYDYDGVTSHNSFEKVLRWDYDRLFKDIYELNEYLQNQRQVLINKQVFRSVRTKYQIIQVDEFVKDVAVTVILEDSWTIVPVPVYKYDDNLGIVTGAGIGYGNVAGTLTDFNLDAYYSEVKSEVNLDWLNVRAGPLFLDFRYNQLWETIKTIDASGDINLKYDYAQSLFRVSLIIPLLWDFKYYSQPILRFPYAYYFYKNDTGEEDETFILDGMIPAYNHMLTWDKVDWVGSLRRGFEFSLEQQSEYNQRDGEMMSWVDGMAKIFLYMPLFNYNCRISSFYYHNDFKKNAGDRIRGILDYRMSGTTGFFWNQNYPFNALSFQGIGDLQISPFFDMGFVLAEGESYEKDDMQYSAGCSVILFPALLPSFSLNIDFGMNLIVPEETEFRISSQLYF